MNTVFYIIFIDHFKYVIFLYTAFLKRSNPDLFNIIQNILYYSKHFFVKNLKVILSVKMITSRKRFNKLSVEKPGPVSPKKSLKHAFFEDWYPAEKI